MLANDDYYWGILEELDLLDGEVTEWEANFLESVRRRAKLSPKQKEIIDKMREKYLG